MKLKAFLFILYISFVRNSGYDHADPNGYNTFLEATTMCNWLTHL